MSVCVPQSAGMPRLNASTYDDHMRRHNRTWHRIAQVIVANIGSLRNVDIHYDMSSGRRPRVQGRLWRGEGIEKDKGGSKEDQNSRLFSTNTHEKRGVSFRSLRLSQAPER